tara:strand:+ start:53 stop:355 length:303 start_codon:yes stop_codon:yes gene_type:complete
MHSPRAVFYNPTSLQASLINVKIYNKQRCNDMANVYVVVKHDCHSDKIVKIFMDKQSAATYSAICNDTSRIDMSEFYIVEKHLVKQSLVKKVEEEMSDER